MSSKNDGPSKGPATPGKDQPGAKKPSAMLDLKATEIKDDKATAASTGTTSTAASASKPGAPSTAASSTGASKPDQSPAAPAAKPASTVPPVSSLAGSVGSAAAARSGSSDAKAAQGSAGGGAQGSGSEKSGSGVSGSSAKPGSPDTTRPADKSAAGGGSGSGSGSGSGGGGGTNGPKAVPPQSEPKRSVGGFFGTLTHLAAGVVGGALVLFGADPIEKQFGLKLTPTAEVPAEVTSRLAAVEKAAAVKPVVDLSALEAQIASAQARLAEMDALKSQVTDLTEAQAKLAKAATEIPTGGAEASSEAVDGLKDRMAKLEETFRTLSGATGPDGNKNAIARLATISGKLSDLERTLNNQLEALRKTVMTELETRVAKTAEASAAAQAGTERIDRELATVKTNAARLTQRAETLKAANDRLADLVRAVQEQSAKLETELEGLKGDVQQGFKTVARPKDLTAAIAPVEQKLSALDSQLETIVKREGARKENAQRIVVALELGNLKRVLDRGGPFAAELEAVAKAADGKIDLGALEKFQSSGVPTSAGLANEFRTLAFQAINAEDAKASEDGVLNRFLSSAKSIVKVRRTEFAPDDTSTEAIVARVEKLLVDGNLSGAFEQSKALSKEARAPIEGWLSRLEARANVDRAIAELERQLKASLGGGDAAPANPGTKG
jgi:hypothetical protein